MKDRFKSFLAATDAGWEDLVALFCFSFICASAQAVINREFWQLSFLKSVSVPAFWAVLFAAFVTVGALSVLLRTLKLIKWCLALQSVAFCMMLAFAYSSGESAVYFNIGAAAVLLLILRYCLHDNGLGIAGGDISDRTCRCIIAGLFVVFTVTVSCFTVIKYATFSHGAFDFGIFCQMFENMAKTGLPGTTIERGEYLSHFAVHFSALFYLLLPGYMLFRSPVYLLCVQAFAVGLGVFPIRRICRSLGLDNTVSAVLCAVYVFYPTMANGCFYDFHENKLLSVLILYTVSFWLERRMGLTALFALLTLSVKEDAMIYVAAISLWMFIGGRRKSEKLFAVSIGALSIVYFLFACQMIRVCGGEIMTSRFENFTPAGAKGGLLSVIRTCFYDIGYLLHEVFAGADTDKFNELTYGAQKLEFVLWTCAPLAFLPFASRRGRNLVLLIPLLVINLMPDWLYQFDIDFQYTYGSAALIIVCAILAIAEMRPERRRCAVMCCLCLCLLFFSSAALPKFSGTAERYASAPEAYRESADILKDIPEDASVTAYGYLVPHLYYVSDLNACPDYYKPLQKTEYYVLDTRYINDAHSEKMLYAMGDDYTLAAEGGFVRVYRLKTAE